MSPIESGREVIKSACAIVIQRPLIGDQIHRGNPAYRTALNGCILKLTRFGRRFKPQAQAQMPRAQREGWEDAATSVDYEGRCRECRRSESGGLYFKHEAGRIEGFDRRTAINEDRYEGRA